MRPEMEEMRGAVLPGDRRGARAGASWIFRRDLNPGASRGLLVAGPLAARLAVQGGPATASVASAVLRRSESRARRLPMADGAAEVASGASRATADLRPGSAAGFGAAADWGRLQAWAGVECAAGGASVVAGCAVRPRWVAAACGAAGGGSLSVLGWRLSSGGESASSAARGRQRQAEVSGQGWTRDASFT